jgi:subtilase family serine protease
MNFRAVARTGVPDPDRENSRERSTIKRVMFRIVLPVASVVGVAAAVLATTIATRAASPQSASNSDTTAVSAPMTTAKCRSEVKLACYTPAQYRVAYDLNPLYSGKATGRPITGAGETIVLVERGGSPTIKNDLRTFDAEFGLPNPALTIDKFGDIPPFDPNNPNTTGNAEETTLSVEYAHAIAPGANIVVAETAAQPGEPGLPQIMNATKSLINQGVGDVIALGTFGAVENSFPGFGSGNYSSLLNLRYALKDAYAHHVTVLAPSGDSGATAYKTFLPPYILYKYQVNAWPASDPLVTAVGGTALNLTEGGNRLSPDTAWADVYGASSGGDSAVFSRPQYQNGVTGIVGAHRGTPDISLSGQPGCWGYYSFAGAGGTGWHIFAGTSEATSIMTGIVALADQAAGHRLGLINPALYKLGERHQAGAKGTGIVSVTSGDTTFDGVKGFHAEPGYNMATGWGTIDAVQFVPALARLG